MLLSKSWAAPLLCCAFLGTPMASHATSCTAQAEMSAADRNDLAAAGQRLAIAVVQQDMTTLQAGLIPAVASQWESIRDVIEASAPAVKGGQAQLRSLYLLDASTLAAPADTQFFCSNANASITVTITMRSLPPGKYAVVLADAIGSPLAGQIGLILGSESNTWKLGGVFIRPGMLGGHDGIYYWERARELARSDSPWAAFYCYEAARYLLVPVDFLSSPNLEKLDQEQSQLKNSPTQAFPYSLAAGDRNWKIDTIRFDASLQQPDLAVTFESTGVSDPAAQRTEATSVLSALLKAQPTLRSSFHGLWANASKDGKVTPVMELPMGQIP